MLFKFHSSLCRLFGLHRRTDPIVSLNGLGIRSFTKLYRRSNRFVWLREFIVLLWDIDVV